MGQSTRARPDLIDGFVFERARNCGDSSEKLSVEDEILAERLAGLKPVASDDVAQRLGVGSLGS